MYDSHMLEDAALIISQNKALGIHKLPEQDIRNPQTSSKNLCFHSW